MSGGDFALDGGGDPQGKGESAARAGLAGQVDSPFSSAEEFGIPAS